VHHVVRFSLARCIWIRVSATLSDMSDCLITESKCSNGTFIMVTLVIWGWSRLLCIVYELRNIQMLIDLNCMLSIDCKPMMLITLNMVKTCLKVFRASHCRQGSMSPAWSLRVSICRPLDHLGSILLSVVTQDLLCGSLVCRWSLSLSSSDADGGY
jgi:hypothetical protein